MQNTVSLPVLYPAKFEDVIGAIGEILRQHQRFLVCGHVRPDGDCIGSQLALYFLLTQMGKTVRLYNSGPILDNFSFVPGIEKIETTFDKTYKPDVSIFVDCGAEDRVTGDATPSGILVNIDHHTSNGHFGDVNYIDPDATAVGEQLFHIITAMDEAISKDIATCLYLAILADSGSFRFTNTTRVTFVVASRLVEAGAEPSAIAQAFFENKTPESLRLGAQALANLHYECGGKLVWSEITQKMYKAVGGEKNEPESLVSQMRAIKGVEVAILIHEIPEGGLRAGLRSRGAVDVSRIAIELGGGGHPNAAGCFIKGDYDALKQQLLSTTRRIMQCP